MADNFLFKISKILFSKYKESLSDVVIVLPSRRSSLFLVKEFSKLISHPIWLPSFYAIDDFLFSVNNLKRANNLELFFAFYNAYKHNMPNGHNLERCYNWANTLLEDFNEADKSCVNHYELFTYLADVKRIENWYLDIGSHKEEIQEYLNFFKQLSSIYQDLVKTLLAENIAYAGLAQRLLVDDLALIKNWLKNNNKQKIIFIGLDALTVSQEKIIDYLLGNNLCDIFWDVDKYFLNDPKQESGKFLRKYKKKWPETIDSISDDFLQKGKKIDIIGATKQINQTKILGHLLQEKSYTPDQLQKTAIVLPNENLLLSVLESIPKHIQNINVTMGYKLSHHPIVSIFEDILNLHLNTRNINVKSVVKIKHYLNKDVLQLLRNPYFKLLLDSFEIGLDIRLGQLVKKTGFNYVNYEDIKNITTINQNLLLQEIFSGSFQTGLELITFFRILIPKLLELIEDNSKSAHIEQECLFIIEEQLLIFKTFLENVKENLDIKLFTKLFNKVLRSSKLNFAGEPLHGIQIMGLLESRTIDFDEVFILSANESELPPATNQNSFIPLDVKLKFNIRTDLDVEAMHANIFYNLIKRPKKTHIIYNQDLSSMSSGERSRFINQLIYEVKPMSNTLIDIKQYNVINKFSLEDKTLKSILRVKDGFIFNQLMVLAKNGFSPSTINLYNYCRKQFYFEKILGVSKQEDIEISIDKAMMGSIIHLVLQKLYTPYIGICLDEKSIINIQGEIIIELINALKHYHIDNTNRGKNLLAIEAIKSIITNFIDHEHNLIKCGNKITIEFLEHEILPQKLNTKLLESVNPQFQNIEINLKGHIDRVDVFNNTYRIIDYKTGLIQDSDLKSMDLNDMPAKPKVLQVLLYAWLFKKKKDIKSIPVLAGIINLRAQNFHFQPCVINKQSHIDEILLINFEKKLENILLEVFNPNQDFEHLNRDEKCRFCD